MKKVSCLVGLSNRSFDELVLKELAFFRLKQETILFKDGVGVR